MSQRRRRNRNADAEDEEERQYVTGGQTLEELDEQYPIRPRNHSRTLLFSELFMSLFNPLDENKKQPSGPQARRAKASRGGAQLSPHEQRRAIIERFISRWRAEVGDDFYPVLRLILPDKDRDRGVYGLKESVIGKLLVKVMKIDKNSDDGYNLLHWKLPGKYKSSRMAGDFAGRCYEVLSKRPMRTDVGDMHIADVNEMLDKLSAAQGEKEQLPIFEVFYQRMNPVELTWLVRIILKQMRVGATEKTFFDIWHPDAEALFSVSSSLRRVCWELWDPSVRLDGDDASVTLMQIFQPQLAQFQFASSFKNMVAKLTGSEEGTEYWIEEKLDGERMQLHLVEDDGVLGGARFGFWSRKAKDYAYLYGRGFQDERSALTRHLNGAFAPGVRNLILDGEMITWDMELDKIMCFGTLKSAALAGKKNPLDDTEGRALYRVFDILYLNDQELTRYTLQDRLKALEKAVPGVHRRLELHEHTVATSPDEIEPQLRRVIAEASEGLVLKNPRSVYSLNQRNDDWIKVKPEYTKEFGENVDVVIIGAYYGTGHRGGRHSSFLCGLRATPDDIDDGADPEKCFSFIKVGGGFKAEDYSHIAHHTHGKWKDWDPKKPPSKYIELGGGEEKQCERPDQWIRPSQSIVIEVKAAHSGMSQQFALGVTMRFPRFKSIRHDRSWDTALNRDEFSDRREKERREGKEKEMNMEAKRRTTKRARKNLVIAGQEAAPAQFEGPKTKVFEGLEFCVLTESIRPKKTKTQLESLIKQNGGQISQRAIAGSDMLLIGEKKVVKVASLIKAGGVDIIKPKWILDCVAQGDNDNFLLPYEPNHLFSVSDAMRGQAEENVDEFGDSYARDLDAKELKSLLKEMPKKEIMDKAFNKTEFLGQLENHGHGFASLKGHVFERVDAYFATTKGVSTITALKATNWVKFGGGRVINDLDCQSITHVIVISDGDDLAGRETAAEVRVAISSRRHIPRIVSQQWLEDCWTENTLLAEERYPSM
ncbi:DNA ligase I [Xylariales sp. AK1849]|nr:DNA ligase I [Xylariales sp. AK1849]